MNASHRVSPGVPASFCKLIAAGFLAAAVGLNAQQPPAAPAPLEPPGTPLPAAPLVSPPGSPQRPMFRTNVDATLLDIRVVDQEGHFVRDLKPEDFRIFEDEVEQGIVTFGLVDLPTEPVKPPTVAGIRVESDVASNARSVEGRLYVIVMDDKPNMMSSQVVAGAPMQINAETYRLRAENYRMLAREFIEEHLTYGDRAALITISGRKDMAQEFTNNRQRLLDSISKFELGYGQETTTFNFNLVPGQSPIESEGRGAEQIDTARSAMIALRSVSTYLAQIPTRRKAIVLFSERMGESFSTNNFTLNLQTDEAKDFRDLIEASARANVGIYVVDPIGAPLGPGARGLFVDDAAEAASLRDSATFDTLRMDGLSSLAESTGGFAVTGSNRFEEGFERIVEENSSYYLIGYTPSNQKMDGKFRRLRVEVTRPGLVVRTRSGYFGKDTRTTEEVKGFSNVSAGLNELLQSPLPVPGLTMIVSATAFRGPKSEADVSVIVEARGGDLSFTPNQTRFNGSMELVMIASDADGKIKASERGSMSMNLSETTHKAIAANGVRVLSRLALKPGRYQLRLAAEDTNVGRTRGTVLYDLDVPDFSKGPLVMSGIILASASASRMPTTGPDKRWNQLLKALPTTQREFAAGDELRQYLEVYVNEKGKTHEVDVVTTVRSEAGQRVFTHQNALTGERGKEKTVTYRVITPIPLKDFTPGQYVLTVEARSRNEDTVPATRQIPFSVR